jgi:hypothetical protein
MSAARPWPVHTAGTADSQQQMLQILIDSGMKMTGKAGGYALWAAASMGRGRMVSQLVAAGARLDADPFPDIGNALQVSCKKGHTRVVKVSPHRICP